MKLSAILSKSGLTDVGYRLYNSDDSAATARITAGVTEPEPFRYSADVTLPDGFTGYIKWDSPSLSRPAYEDIVPNVGLQSVLDAIDGISMTADLGEFGDKIDSILEDTDYIDNSLRGAVATGAPSVFTSAPPTAEDNVYVVINMSDFGFGSSSVPITFTILGETPIVVRSASFEVKRERVFTTKTNGQAVGSVPRSAALTDSTAHTNLIYHIVCEDAGLDFTCRIIENTTLLALYNARL